jgi:hypothetical protein
MVLILQSKETDWQIGVKKKKKTYLFIVYKKSISLVKINTNLKWKNGKRFPKSKQEFEEGFKLKLIRRDKQGHFTLHFDKGTIYQEDLRVVNAYTLNIGIS